MHNPGYIDEIKGKDIFQKRFSTKGSNRGWGTSSMKILGENFLKGNVNYEIDKLKRTRFFISLPTKYM